jgi:hypothetical protein
MCAPDCLTYNLTGIRSVEALQQRHDCALPTARCTNQRNGLAWLHVKIQPSQYWNSGSVGVSEVNPVKSHSSMDFLKILIFITGKFMFIAIFLNQ